MKSYQDILGQYAGEYFVNERTTYFCLSYYSPEQVSDVLRRVLDDPKIQDKGSMDFDFPLFNESMSTIIFEGVIVPPT